MVFASSVKNLAAVTVMACMSALLCSGGAAAPTLRADFPGNKQPGSMDVDIELVLAVDVSYSMDPDEQALQREGYAQAIVSKEFLQALREGMHGRIAVTYVEWAGAADQRTLIPWRMIDGLAAAQKFADDLMAMPYRRAFRTSISGAILYAMPQFDNNGFSGIRRVIDVSGDGANNQGRLVESARDEVVARGITINGLPIMLKRTNAATMDIDNLDVYYEDCVIGGAGAFVVPVREREKFREAIRTKLVLEVAGRTPNVVPAQAKPRAPRISCTIGERMWQERWGNGGMDAR
jgi:hypothetical protein